MTRLSIRTYPSGYVSSMFCKGVPNFGERHQHSRGRSHDTEESNGPWTFAPPYSLYNCCVSVSENNLPTFFVAWNTEYTPRSPRVYPDGVLENIKALRAIVKILQRIVALPCHLLLAGIVSWTCTGY